MNETLDSAIETKANELVELTKKYNVGCEVTERGVFAATVHFFQFTKKGNYVRMQSFLEFTATGKVRVKTYWYSGRTTEVVAAKNIEDSVQFIATLNDEARAKMWA